MDNIIHNLPVHEGVIHRYSSILPHTKNVHVRLIGNITLPLGVIGYLSCLSPCVPVMDL